MEAVAWSFDLPEPRLGASHRHVDLTKTSFRLLSGHFACWSVFFLGCLGCLVLPGAAWGCLGLPGVASGCLGLPGLLGVASGVCGCLGLLPAVWVAWGCLGLPGAAWGCLECLRLPCLGLLG